MLSVPSRCTPVGALDCVCALWLCAAGEGCAGWLCCAITKDAQKISRNRAAMRSSSFRGCIVSGLCMYSEWRQSLGCIQLNLNLAPLAIPSCIGWTVSEHILVAQLYSYLCGDVGQFVHVVHAEHASAGYIGDFIQKIRPVALFRGSSTIVK